MPDFSSFISPDFVSSIQKFLDERMESFKEYDLLSHLDNQGFFKELDSEISSSLLLFQKHFLIFHVLYSINQEMVETKKGALLISPLEIKKLDYVEADTQIGEVDALSEYYLDLQHLKSANEDNVNELLDGFWEMYLRNEKRGDALKTLGLCDPVTDKEITQCYRKLASVHHPDKGGDTNKIQAINEAYAILIKV